MIKPYKRRPPHREVAFLGMDGKVLTEDGRRRLRPSLGSGGDVVVYTDTDRCKNLLVRGFGSALCWGGNPIRLKTDRYEAIVLQPNALVPNDRTYMEGLVAWRRWAEDLGASVASIGSTAFSVLRATLEREFALNNGDLPPVRVLVGARQHLAVPVGTYEGDLHHYDISAAYPTTMARMVVGDWQRVGRVPFNRLETWVRAGHPTFVHCTVHHRGFPPGPLPLRPHRQRHAWEAVFYPVTYPYEGRRQGTWTGPEVLAAVAAGASVTIDSVWVMAGTHAPFRSFYDATMAGRTLPGLAGHLVKMTSNALWGQFAIGREDRAYLAFKDGRRTVTHVPPIKGRPRDIPLAESITGSVRAKLYHDLLAPAGDQLLCAHTDGGWVRGDFVPDEKSWRLKDVAEVMDLISPQAYAFRPTGTKEVRYCLAGTPPQHRELAFREVWKQVVPRKEPRIG